MNCKRRNYICSIDHIFSRLALHNSLYKLFIMALLMAVLWFDYSNCTNNKISLTFFSLFAVSMAAQWISFTIALKYPVWGCPICILWGGGPGSQPLFTLGLTCVCFALRDFLSLKGGPSTKSIFSFIFKLSFERHSQNLQRNPCKFKNWMEYVRQISMWAHTFYHHFTTIWCIYIDVYIYIYIPDMNNTCAKCQ